MSYRPMSIASKKQGRVKKILFVGGNGFPVATYGPFLDALAKTFSCDVTALDLHGAFEATPREKDGRRTWHGMVDYVKPELEVHDMAVGHSLGGAVMLAASEGKRAVHKWVLLDPPLFSPATRAAMELQRRYKFGMFHKIIQRTRNAQGEWGSYEEAEVYLRQYKPYSLMNHATWEMFKAYGLRETADGRVARVVSPQTESDIFESTPTEIPPFPWQPYAPEHVGLYPRDSFAQYMRRRTGAGQRGQWNAGGTYYYSVQHEFTRRNDLDFVSLLADNMEFETMSCHFEPFTNPEGLAEGMLEELKINPGVLSAGRTSKIGSIT
eukprot:TRINITY_DN5927_c0_g1_i3.p1 TRINITY_DN5927_c0_g1~~TRINITY_DN5927_c0_g1_i3.p1  ORF type:complete len:348 (+),score=45.11 TRINITY_DN5927_c0_g1_i3:76-1044(+)